MHYRVGGRTIAALDRVGFTVPRGQFMAIVGPSGSGKSTLLNMLGCLDRPDSGRHLLEDVAAHAQRQVGIRDGRVGFDPVA